MSGINWQLLQMPNVGMNALAAFQQGMKIGDEIQQARDKREYRNALAQMVGPDNADNSAALGVIARNNPELALKFQDRARDAKFRAAQARFVTGNIGGDNAPMGAPAMPRQGPAVTEGMPAPGLPPRPGPVSGYGGGTFEFDGTQVTPVDMGNNAAPIAVQPRAVPQTAPSSPLGDPQDDADRAFLEMMQVDPGKALEIRSGLRNEAVKRLKLIDDTYDMAIGRLANVADDNGYQAMLGELESRFKPIGVDIRSMVPPTYPGKGGIRKLLMTALDAKDQLGALVQRDRLEAYVADIAADNERADRNTDSLIADRRSRRAETRRNNNMRNETTRRGQDNRGGRERLPVVQTPEEAARLPKGTRFKTPDGQVRIVP